MTNSETIKKTEREIFKTHNLVKIGLLTSVAFVLMMLDFAVPIFPAFLKLDISDVPAIIGTFAMGPVAGILIELNKNILNALTRTTSMGIGEVANFIVGIAYIIPLGIIYNKIKSKKGVILGAIIGTLSMTIVACLFNYFILIPAYSTIVFNQPISVFVDMANVVNNSVTNFVTLILFAIAPFNLIKGIIISIIGYWLYKVLKPIIHKF